MLIDHLSISITRCPIVTCYNDVHASCLVDKDACMSNSRHVHADASIYGVYHHFLGLNKVCFITLNLDSNVGSLMF